jgi:RND family efflux transporter MFP subunit
MWKSSLGLILIAGAIAVLVSAIKPARTGAGVAQEQGEVALETKGYLVPIEQVQVSPRVAGQITEILFEEGTHVEKGALLARIDPTPYELDLRRAEALLTAARARLEEIKGAMEDKKVPRNARLEMLGAEVVAAEAAATKAKWLLDGTHIRAPVGGTILTKFGEKGNVLDPHSFNLKSILCDMADLTRMEVDVAVQERDFRKVFRGQKCQIQLEAFPERTFKGVVSRLMPLGDRAKGAIQVRVRMDVPKEAPQLRPDMGALVSFLGKKSA